MRKHIGEAANLSSVNNELPPCTVYVIMMILYIVLDIDDLEEDEDDFDDNDTDDLKENIDYEDNDDEGITEDTLLQQRPLSCTKAITYSIRSL